MITNYEKIRLLLFRQRKTQAWLSKKANASRNTINAICNGKSCRYETAKRIADALNVPVEELLAE